MGRLKFVRAGVADGPALVCLHGFLGRAADWNAFAGEWGTSRRLFLVDLPGHDGLAPCGADEFAERLVAMLDEENLRSCVLAGYSLGGRLALHSALRFPERFPVFIGVSTTAGVEDWEARRQADLRIAERLRKCDHAAFGDFLKEWWNLPVFDSPRKKPEDFERFLADRIRHDPARMAECLELWSPGVMPSHWDDLADYTGCAFLAAGARDLKYVELSRRMASAFRNADVSILPDCGHRLLEEDPLGLARELRNWPPVAQALASPP